MASQLYTDYKVGCLSDTNTAHKNIDLGADTIKCAIVNGTSDYTFSAAHQDYDDIGAYTLNAGYNGEANQTLSNITTAAGVFDNTADLTFTAVAIVGGLDVDVLVHYEDSGVIGTSPLICYHDAFTPVTPNGGDITVAYDGQGIFAL